MPPHPFRGLPLLLVAMTPLPAQTTAADQARLFEAFHRASNVGETPGTGLGLLLVKRCFELHYGRIELHSEEGIGTTFTLRLPVRSDA